MKKQKKRKIKNKKSELYQSNEINTPPQKQKNPIPECSLFLKIVFIALMIVFFIMIIRIILSSDLSNSISEIFSSNIDSISLSQLKGNIGGAFAFSIYVTLFFIGLIGIINPKKFNFALLITIFFITFIIFAGIFIIPQVIGTQPIRFNLNPSGIGIIKCNSSDSKTLVGDPVSCQVNTTHNSNLSYEAIKILFTYQNLTTSEAVISRINGTFIAPKDLRSIYFELLGTDYPNVTISTSWRYHFETIEEYNSNKPIFLASFLSLILLAFATIPSIILNFKKLISNRTNSST